MRPSSGSSGMRPQDLFETFADLELAWGPNWSGSLKSLWLGEGEAIGDIVVGEELAEHLGTEPMHPVLMDLCTGVAFPAFPALLAAEQGVSDLFLPLRYGQVMLRAKMPRRFYCRATWHPSELNARPRFSTWTSSTATAVAWAGFDEFTVKRAPREALLRGLGGDATRLLYTLGWHEVPPPPASEDGAEATANGTWLIAGFDELAAKVPGCIPFDRTTDPERLGTAAGTGRRARPAVLRCRLARRRTGRPGVGRRASKRGSRPRSPTCSARCTPCRAARSNCLGGCGSSPNRPSPPNPVSRSTRCRRRCGDSGAPRSTRNRRCAPSSSTSTVPRKRCRRWPTCWLLPSR